MRGTPAEREALRVLRHVKAIEGAAARLQAPGYSASTDIERLARWLKPHAVFVLDNERSIRGSKKPTR